MAFVAHFLFQMNSLAVGDFCTSFRPLSYFDYALKKVSHKGQHLPFFPASARASPPSFGSLSAETALKLFQRKQIWVPLVVWVLGSVVTPQIFLWMATLDTYFSWAREFC